MRGRDMCLVVILRYTKETERKEREESVRRAYYKHGLSHSERKKRERERKRRGEKEKKERKWREERDE